MDATLDLLHALRNREIESEEDIIAGLNRFRDNDIPSTLRSIFAAIRGEKSVSDIIFEDQTLRELSVIYVGNRETRMPNVD